MSFNSNTMGATTFPSGAHVLTPGFCDVRDFYVLCCRSSFVFWSLHFVPVCYVRTFLMIVAPVVLLLNETRSCDMGIILHCLFFSLDMDTIDLNDHVKVSMYWPKT